MQQPTKESILPPESECRRRTANPTRLRQTQWPSVDNNAGHNTCSSSGSALHSNEPRMAQQAHCRLRALPQASSSSSELVWQPSPPPTSLIAVRQLTNLPVSYCSESEKNEKKLNQLPTPQTAQLDRTSLSVDDRLCRLKQVDSHGKHDYYQFGSVGRTQVATNLPPAKQLASSPTKGKLTD